MMRSIGAVLAGYALWTVVWLGGNALLFGQVTDGVGAGERYGAAGPLVGVILLSVVCSLAAGAVATAITRAVSRRSLLVLGVLLLATGIGVQAGIWNLMPVWYHVSFLALLIPVVLVGGKIPGPR